MDRGAWRAMAHRMAENWTQLKRLSTAHKRGAHRTMQVRVVIRNALGKSKQSSEGFGLGLQEKRCCLAQVSEKSPCFWQPGSLEHQGKKDAVGGWWKRGQGAIQRGLPGSSWSQLMGKDVVRTLRVS